MGYRQPGDPPDEREYVIRPDPFWESPHEQAAYERAVHENPIGENEGRMGYIVRIASLVEGHHVKAPASMPRPNLSPLKFKQRMMELERQREPGED